MTLTPRLLATAVATLALAALALTLALAPAAVTAFSPAPAPLWVINTFLQNKMYGKYVAPVPDYYVGLGPCPDYTGGCHLSLTNLPASVKAIGVTIPAPFNSVVTLGDALNSGDVTLYDMECDDIEAGTISLSGRALDSSRYMLNVLASGIALNCNLKTEIKNLKVVGFSTGNIYFDVNVNKAGRQRGGVFANITFILTAEDISKTPPQLWDLANHLPSRMAVQDCYMDVDAGVAVSSVGGLIPFLNPTQGTVGDLTSFVINTALPFLGGAACNGLNQLVSTTAGGAQGQLSILLEELYNFTTAQQNLSAPDPVAQEQSLVSALPASTVSGAWMIGQSKIVKGAGFIVNNWLGNATGSWSTPAALPVNDFMARLTAPNAGVAHFANLNGQGLDLTLTLPPLAVNIDPVEVKFTGLNTITALQVLDNPAARNYNYSLDNHLGIASFGYNVTVDLTLIDNIYNSNTNPSGWVNPNSTRLANQAFRVNLVGSVSNLDAVVSLFLVMIPQATKATQIGQLLGASAPGNTLASYLRTAAACSSPSLVGLTLTYLQLAIGLAPPVLSMPLPASYDPGIISLVNLAAPAIIDIIQGVLAHLPQISQGKLRSIVNNLLDSLLVAGSVTTECPPYYRTYVPIIPDFKDSLGVWAVSTLINKAVGGYPVPAAVSTVNGLMPYALQFLVANFLTSGVRVPSGGPTAYAFNPAIALTGGYTFQTQLASSASLQVAHPIQLGGLDSITRLQIMNNGVDSTDLEVHLALGTDANPLALTLGQHWVVNYSPTYFPTRPHPLDQVVSFGFALAGVQLDLVFKVQFDLDRFYALTFSQLFHVPCLLSPIIASDSTASFGISVFNVTVAAPTPASPTPFFTSIQALQAEHPGPALSNMANYVLNSLSLSITDLVNAAPGNNYDPSTCSSVFSLSTLILNSVINLVLYTNTSAVLEQYLGLQPPVPSYATSEAAVVVPSNALVVDLTQSTLLGLLSNVLGGLTQTRFDEGLASLVAASNPLSSTFIKEADGSVTMDLDLSTLPLHFLYAGLSINSLIRGGVLYFERLRLTNVSSLDVPNLKLLYPASRFITQTSIHLSGTVNIQISMRLMAPPTFTGPAQTSALNENITLSLSVTDVHIDIQALTAMNAANFADLTLGQMLAYDPDTQTFSLSSQLLPCLFGLFFENGITLPQLQIRAANVAAPSLTSTGLVLSNGFTSFLNQALVILTDLYGQDLGDLTQGALRGVVNYFIDTLLGYTSQCAPAPYIVYPDSGKYLNFEKSSLVQFVSYLASNWLAGSNHDYALLNFALNSVFTLDSPFLTYGTDGTGGLGIRGLKLWYKGSVLATITFVVSDIGLGNLGTLTDLVLLQPISNSSFNVSASMKGPVSFKLTTHLNITGLYVNSPYDGTVDTLTMTFTVSELSLRVAMLVLVNVADMLALSPSMISLTKLPCVFTAFDKFSIVDFGADFASLHADLTCSGRCDSPIISTYLKATDLQADLNPTQVKAVTDALVTFAQSKMTGLTFSGAIASASTACASSLDLTTVIQALNPPPKSTLNIAVIFALALLGMGMGAIALTPFLIIRHRAIRDRMTAIQLSLATHEPGATPESIARFMTKCEREGVPIAWHPIVPTYCKVFLPILAFLNVAMLGMAFLIYKVFTLDGELTILGNTGKFVTLVPWTIGGAVNDMWGSGSYYLVFLIVGFSCTWPIVKNLALVFLWAAPDTLVDHHMKEWYLIQLDWLGKFSFLDVYVVVGLVAFLRYHLPFSEAPVLVNFPIPTSALIIDVYITPGVGIVLMCLAASCSLIVNHIVVYWNHKVEYANLRFFKLVDGVYDEMLSPKAGVRIRMCDYIFSSTAPNGQRDRFKPSAKIYLAAFCFSSFLVTAITLGLDFLHSSSYGALNYLIVFILGTSDRFFMMYTFGGVLATGSDGTVTGGILMAFFEALYYITIVVAPLMHIPAYVVLFFYPFSVMDSVFGLFWCRVIQYWASIEVLLLGIVAASLEIKVLVDYVLDYITSDICSSAVPLLTQLLGAENGACLGAVVELMPGFYLLLFGVFYELFVGGTMLRIARTAIRDRLETMEGIHHRPWSYWEYFILDKLLINGAAHHKPVPKPSMIKQNLDLVRANPSKWCAKCLWTINPFSCLCEGIADLNEAMDHRVVGGSSHPSAKSKWNPVTPSGRVEDSAMATPAPSGQWNMATPAASGQWNAAKPASGFFMPFQSGRMGTPSMSSTPSMPPGMSLDGRGGGAPSGDFFQSANPVYSKEQRNAHDSVDV